MIQPVLCYVDNNFAYFTTQELKKQWGDDWNDAPYEHNAGDPYECQQYNIDRGDTPWEIVVVMWAGPFETPCANVTNSRYSVEMINAGMTPWLRTDEWTKPPAAIMAGTTLSDFIDLMYQAGGKVYTEARGK